MKCIILSGLLGLALVSVAHGQTAAFYINDGIVLSPPQIDATNFVNNNIFQADTFNAPYETSSTVNYTNVGQMSGSYGFRFETTPPGAGMRRRAGTLFNSGSINAGAKLLASATNILHSGAINMGFDSLLNLTGHTVDLNRGTVTSQSTGFFTVFDGTNYFSFLNSGIFDGYWSVGTANGTNVEFLFPGNFNTVPAFTPFHLVTNRTYFTFITSLFPPNQLAYVDDVFTGPSNRVVNAVFLGNADPAYTVNVYFPFSGDTWVEWKSAITNSAGQLVTNYLYLRDTFGVRTNLQVAVNGSGDAPLHPTYKPVNYTFSQGGPLPLGSPAPQRSPGGTFDTSNFLVTNDFSAYEAIFKVTSKVLGSVPGQTVTNLPGRVEIRAEGSLNLSRAHIDSLNYLLLEATNHFVSSSRAQITTPWSDINLRSTNGSLAITNLLQPTVPRPEGTVDLWSGRWTNVIAGITNFYHVLFVDSRISPYVATRIQDLTLRSTNTVGGAGGGSILISDIMNVTRNLLLETERLTVTTNGPGSPAASGGINLLSSDILWSSATPRLQYLTNSGTIGSGNAVFFGGSRTSPFFSTNFNEPYVAMVNHGQVFIQGSLIWADYFENTGLLSAGLGSLTLQATNAWLKDGSFLATSGDISITSGSLVVSNHAFQAGRALSFTVTNLLDDSSVFNPLDTITNKNTWIAGDGINLLVRPAQSSLLGTTILATAPPLREAISRWAAEDRSCSSAGFTNNAALGRLILDGGDDSLFTFTGTGGNNALYVDYLELRNFVTNRDANGNFPAIVIDPGMKVYFAQAVANGASIAEKLDGKNGGGFCWVTTYTGFYSSTNRVYPDGTTNTFNAALVGSCNLDSDGDGLVNCVDPTPILRPQDLALAVSIINQPAPKAQLSWQSGPYAANYVYFKNSFNATNWQLLTNFVSSPAGGRVSVVDPISAASPRYYRVRVDANQP